MSEYQFPDVATSSEDLSHDNLIAGENPAPVTVYKTLTSGETVVRGHALGVVTSGGKLLISLSGASDGSEDVRYIAAEDKDASAEDKPILVYAQGVFNEDEITFGASHTAATVKAGLEQYGIFLRDPVTKTPA